MIKIENLSLNFENKKIFNKQNLSVDDNKMTVIVGSNGVGKTTLLKIISGAIKIKTAKIENTAKEIFFLPQKIRYPEGITLFEYVLSSFYKNSLKWYISAEEKVKTEKILEELELIDRKNVIIDNLSSGELQKANIAMAMVSDSDCLLLDEPTSNLDLINQIKILGIIKNISLNGITCLIIMHDLNLAAKYGDYFIGMSKNCEIIKGEKNEFFTAENLNKIYGLNFEVTKNEEKYNIQVNN